MKIGIQTWGSNGDIRPMLALAAGLRQAGHQVALTASSIDNRRHHDLAERLGITYRQIPEHVDFDMQDFARRSFRMNTLQWLRALLDAAFFPYEAAIYRAAEQLVDENDCLIGHHFMYPLKLAALLRKKPFFSVTYCPVAIPDSAAPPFRLPNLGPVLNRFNWRLLDAAFNWILAEPLTRLWREAGLKPPASILNDLLCSDRLNLIAADPLFCAGGRWQAHHRVCGFLEMTEDAKVWTMPDSLAEFLADGPAPVYMTFGSLQQAVPEWSMDLFINAAAKAGCRAVIQTGVPGYAPESRDGDIYFIGGHPHQPVFDRCAAVVHHGGAGTTHAATRAGRPSVVVPFMDEQLFWGKKLQALGIAGKPLPAKRADADGLAGRLRMVLASAAMKEKARQAGASMQTNDGVARAVELLGREFL